MFLHIRQETRDVFHDFIFDPIACKNPFYFKKCHVNCAEKCKGIIINCNILCCLITVVFLDTPTVKVEVNIAISLPPVMFCLVFPNLQGFHMECKIFRWWIHFVDNFSFRVIAILYTLAPKRTSGLFL